jgi:archaemetzincin
MPEQRLTGPLRQKDFRKSPNASARQVRTGYILDELLAPQLPKDAAAMIALTNEDLYPDESMNFVFGQASFDNRVGVWSLYRLTGKNDPQQFLLRTLKIATHETGHMFSIRHCTKYECVMSGSNYIGETDRHPVDACPECMAKIAWLSKISPAERYRKLADYCVRTGLKDEETSFTKKLVAVEK